MTQTTTTIKGAKTRADYRRMGIMNPTLCEHCQLGFTAEHPNAGRVGGDEHQVCIDREKKEEAAEGGRRLTPDQVMQLKALIDCTQLSEVLNVLSQIADGEAADICAPARHGPKRVPPLARTWIDASNQLEIAGAKVGGGGVMITTKAPNSNLYPGDRMNEKLLMRHVVAYVRRLGGTVRRRDGEYALRLPYEDANGQIDPKQEKSTYFTDSLLDVLETARAWMGTHSKIVDAEKCLPLRWRLTSDAERFFLDHAGFSQRLHCGSTTEPRLEGIDDARLRSARELAKAEAWAKEHGYTFAYWPDADADESFMDGESDEFKEESLCGCYGGDSDYERVVQAELALEQMGEVEARAEGMGVSK